MADFIVTNAALAGQEGHFDIAVEKGRIAKIGTGLSGAERIEDAGGRLLTPGLVESHIHLDKAGIIGRCSLCAGTLEEAVSETAKAKANFTTQDVYERAASVVTKAVLNGTNRLRTFVEIDPRAGFRSFEAIVRIKRDFARAIDIEIVAFAQEGLTNDPGTEEMLDAALGQGADLVGGCPYTDPEPALHIEKIFDLAEKHGVAVDFHIDFDLDPEGSNLPKVIAETVRRGYQGRVSVGHASKLSAMQAPAFLAVGEALAEAGIGLVVLPATDLFLMGRDRDHLVPRGMVPVHRLTEYGLVGAVSTNNVMNPFTPFGDVSLMRMANLYANIAQIGTPAGLDQVFAMIGAAPARLCGVADYGIVEGGPASFVLFDTPSAADAVAEIAPALKGWKNGVQTFDRPLPRLLV